MGLATSQRHETSLHCVLMYTKYLQRIAIHWLSYFLQRKGRPSMGVGVQTRGCVWTIDNKPRGTGLETVIFLHPMRVVPEVLHLPKFQASRREATGVTPAPAIEHWLQLKQQLLVSLYWIQSQQTVRHGRSQAVRTHVTLQLCGAVDKLVYVLFLHPQQHLQEKLWPAVDTLLRFYTLVMCKALLPHLFNNTRRLLIEHSKKEKR